MRSFPDIFSRYRRVASPVLDLEIIQAAEEFFPLVNALRRFMLWLAREGVDMFEILCQWAFAIKALNRTNGVPLSRSHQGSIADFLDFLENSFSRIGTLSQLRGEMITWERCKDRLRRASLTGSVTAGAVRDDWVYTNPTLILESFQHIHAFLEQEFTSGDNLFAFYVKVNAEPAIVKISSRAKTVLDIARSGIKPTLLGAGLDDDFSEGSDNANQERLNILLEVVQVLKTKDLILEGRDLFAFAQDEILQA